MIGILFCLQFLVLPPAMCEDKAHDHPLDSSNKDYDDGSYKKIIELYDKATPGTILPHYKCDINRPPYCRARKLCSQKDNHKILRCAEKARSDQMVDPKKWKPHPDCSPVFIMGLNIHHDIYYKGCKKPERIKTPWCKVNYLRKKQYRACINIEPIDGKMSDWSQWSECSKTCGAGEKTRNRECTSPLHGGKECEGGTTENEKCVMIECAGGDGGNGSNGGKETICCTVWFSWTKYSPCSLTCGGGKMHRTRKCKTFGESAVCNHLADEYYKCNSQLCDGFSRMSNQNSKMWIIYVVAAVGSVCVIGIIAAVMVILKKKKKNTDTGFINVYE